MAAQELAGHRRGRHRGGRHRRRLAAAQLRRRGQHDRRLRRRPPGRVRRGRGHGRGDAAVHPDVPRPRHRHRARALDAGGRAAQGRRVVGMPVPEGSPGDRLLESLGYQVRWTSWVLAAARGRRHPARRCPRGTPSARRDPSRVRGRARRSSRTRSSSGRSASAQPYEDFGAERDRSAGFEPWHLRVVVDPDGDGRRRGASCSRGRPRPRATSPGSPYVATSATAAWRRRCWSTPSRRPGRTVRRVGAVHGLPHRGARPLREGRHAVTSVWVNRAIDL